MLYLHLFCVISMFISGRMLIKDLLYYARRILLIFLCIIKVKEGLGGSLMHVYVWEHIAFLTEPIDGC